MSSGKIYFTAVAFFISVFVFASSDHNGWRQGEMEVRVFINSISDAGLLSNLHLDSEVASTDGRVVNVFVTQGELEMIKATGLKFIISVPDLNENSRLFKLRQAGSGYLTYEQVVSLADSLSYNFSTICKKVIFGTSAGGRELAALKISRNVEENEPEPSILFDGGIHGDEVLGPEIIIRFARDLCLSYGVDSLLTGLINSRAIWLYYMVNPDGTEEVSRYNSNGVDCNRDAGYMWNGEGNSPEAFSQNETRALRECMLQIQPSIYTNFHAGTQAIIIPWSFRADPPPDLNNIDQLAWVYSNTSGYSSLPYGQGYPLLGYYSFGSTKDFLYGTLGNVGWSIELSTNKQPPSSDIDLYYNLNRPAMTEMVTRSGWGLEGVVTDSVTGLPVAASVWVNGYFPVYSNPANGDYHKYVTAGNYSITVKANGYRTKTIAHIGVPQTGSTVTNFRLVPDNNFFAASMIACRIPVNSFNGIVYPAFSPAVLGPSDSATYSLWKNGWVIVDLQDTLVDGPGVDFRIIEGTDSLMGFFCYAGETRDGPWLLIGSGKGTTDFDLALALDGKINKARYMKIVDDGDGPDTGSVLGFDLDAIEVINISIPVSRKKPSQTQKVQVFPNPARDYIFVSAGDKCIEKLSILTNTGKEIQNIHTIPGSHVGIMDLTDIQDGCYLLEIDSGHEHQFKKIIIAK